MAELFYDRKVCIELVSLFRDQFVKVFHFRFINLSLFYFQIQGVFFFFFTRKSLIYLRGEKSILLQRKKELLIFIRFFEPTDVRIK